MPRNHRLPTCGLIDGPFESEDRSGLRAAEHLETDRANIRGDGSAVGQPGYGKIFVGVRCQQFDYQGRAAYCIVNKFRIS